MGAVQGFDQKVSRGQTPGGIQKTEPAHPGFYGVDYKTLHEEDLLFGSAHGFG